MDQTLASSETPTGRRTLRRRLAVSAVVVALLAALVLTPPLVNVNRFSRRIAASMSASLGRPVHLDSVSMHLLPFPGFTLTNLVVSEDPAFGSEPSIRANSVETRLRVSSLWRRRVEFSRVHFIDPSVNLVRNPQGRWNLDSILVHASRIDAAPTAQKGAGPAPRFPYIEATGARVNVKLGDEKMPFSLTDSDFALWLPSSQLWRVRLEGLPVRTDANVANVGTMRLEGSLEGAPRLEQVPVDLTVSWRDAPLGEATRLLLGRDAGWRGTLHIDATLRGPLGAAGIAAHVTLNDLRRADFVPSELLDVSARCQAVGNAARAELSAAECRLDPGGSPALLTLASPRIVLEHPLDSAVQFDADSVPLPWIFGWLQLFSPRIASPAQAPAGTASLHVARSTDHAWSGAADVQLPPALGSPAAAGAATLASATPPAPLHWNVSGTPLAAAPNTPAVSGACGQSLVLAPATLRLAPAAPLVVAGTLDRCGSIVHVAGQANASLLANAAATLPPLLDGTADLLPQTAAPAAIDFTCTRAWGGPQTCSAQHAAPPAPRLSRRRKP